MKNIHLLIFIITITQINVYGCEPSPDLALTAANNRRIIAEIAIDHKRMTPSLAKRLEELINLTERLENEIMTWEDQRASVTVVDS